MTDTFKKSLATFIEKEGLELVDFKEGQRKDDVLLFNQRPTATTLSGVFPGNRIPKNGIEGSNKNGAKAGLFRLDGCA